jgi:hypothetical protein
MLGAGGRLERLIHCRRGRTGCGFRLRGRFIGRLGGLEAKLATSDAAFAAAMSRPAARQSANNSDALWRCWSFTHTLQGEECKWVELRRSPASVEPAYGGLGRASGSLLASEAAAAKVPE